MSADGAESIVGRQIGSHRILSLLGAGGMGEVYRAKDTILGREVAIKVLPQAFVHDEERIGSGKRRSFWHRSATLTLRQSMT